MTVCCKIKPTKLDIHHSTGLSVLALTLYSTDQAKKWVNILRGVEGCGWFVPVCSSPVPCSSPVLVYSHWPVSVSWCPLSQHLRIPQPQNFRTSGSKEPRTSSSGSSGSLGSQALITSEPLPLRCGEPSGEVCGVEVGGWFCRGPPVLAWWRAGWYWAAGAECSRCSVTVTQFRCTGYSGATLGYTRLHWPTLSYTKLYNATLGYT